MSPHVLLILREGESPRCVGPFVAALSAQQEATALELREGEFLVQPLVPPVISAQASRGRHALVPSPVPRDVMCEACGKPYLPTHSSAAPGPNARHPFRAPKGHVVVADSEDLSPETRALATRLLRERDDQLGECGVRALYEQFPPPVSPKVYPSFPAGITDLAAGGRPIISWIGQRADLLRRFAPLDLPVHENWPKETENP